MYPQFVETLKEVDQELYEVVTKNWDLANKGAALDAKTRVLITMALDAFSGAGEGVKSLAATAKRLGASDDEIKETLRIAYMVSGNHTLITGLNAFKK